jgi:hypothetical protein
MRLNPAETSDPDGHRMDGVLDLFCTLPPLDRQGRRVSIQSLLEHAVAWSTDDSGAWFEFVATEEVAYAVFAFVLAERQCCPQFSYEFTFAPSTQSVRLRVGANAALVEPLHAMYAALASEAGIDARQ